MSCCCGKNLPLLFPCSGAADVGELTDRSARAAMLEGLGRMFCLAGVAAGFPEFVSSARGAPMVVAIDGCSKGCATACLKNAGIEEIKTVG